MKKIKVLEVLAHYNYPIAGYSTRSQEIVKNISFFCRPIILTNQPDGKNKIKRKIHGHQFYKVPELPFRVPFLGSRVITPALERWVVKKIFQENHIDLVHAHTPYSLSSLPLRVGKKIGAPTIYEVRGLWEESWVTNESGARENWLYRKIKDEETKTMKLADLVVAISQGIKKDLTKRGIPSNKITIVPNGVNIADFRPIKKDQRLTRKLGLKGKTVLGYIGTIKKMEGLDLVIESLAKINNKKIVFLMVGYGDHEGFLKKLTKRLGIESQVIFSGAVPRSKINQYYSIIDLCVYPRIKARVSEIVTPLKPLEAMAMEKFVLASDVGGLKEMVIPKVSGDLFKADSQLDLAKKIMYYVKNYRKRQKIGKSARQWVRKNRDWKSLGKLYKDIYRELLKKNEQKS